MKLDAIVKALEAFQAKQEEHENCFRDIWSRLTTDNTGNENRNNDNTDPEPPLGTEGIEFFFSKYRTRSNRFNDSTEAENNLRRG